MTDIQPLDSYPPGAPADGGDGTGRRKPSSGTVVAAVLGALALIVGSLALIRAVNAPSGAPSPEDAVKNLFDAVASEDVIGVLQSLEPAERETLRGPIEDIASELKRIGILAQGFDLQSISGVGLEFRDVALSTTTLGEGIAAVSVEGGTVNTAVFPRDLPLGPFFDDFFEQWGEDDPRDAEPTEETTPLAEDGPFQIVAVERDGGWYVSLWYSVAEAARQDAGLDIPAFGRGLQPAGASSPEDAVRQLIDAGAALDLRSVFQLLPPGEASALHDYAPLFLDDAEAEIAEFVEQEGFSLTVSDLELETEGGGDRARVAINGFSIDASFDDGFLHATYGDGTFSAEYEGEYDSGSVEYDGECFRITTVYEDEFFEDEPTEEEMCRGDEDFPPLPEDLDDLTFAVSAVQVDGEWFVSPTRTVLDSIVQGLRMIDREDLDALAEGGFGLLYFPFYGLGGGYSESTAAFGSSGELQAPERFLCDTSEPDCPPEGFFDDGGFEAYEPTPEEQACYDAEDAMTDEEWDSGFVPPECQAIYGGEREEVNPPESVPTTTIPGEA